MTRGIVVWTLLFMAFCLAIAGCGAEQPAEVVSSGFTPAAVCLVPDVVGLGAAAAEGQLVSLGLQPVKGNQYDPGVAEGAVISQDPPGGTRLEPCHGDVAIVVSLGPMPGPTAPPTTTPSPTPVPPTLTPTPIPPTPTPTPDPRLFWDDFETGIKPEWGLSGDGFAVVNGFLAVEGGMLESKTIGDASWKNYRIRLVGFDTAHSSRFSVSVRVQDRGSLMRLDCVDLYAPLSNNPHRCVWKKVVSGEEQEIPTTAFGLKDGTMEIEVEGSVYSVFLNGEQAVYFVDDTFKKGGFRLWVKGDRVVIDSVEVAAIP